MQLKYEHKDIRTHAIPRKSVKYWKSNFPSDEYLPDKIKQEGVQDGLIALRSLQNYKLTLIDHRRLEFET